MYDIVFLSYDEPNADENYETLVSRFPYAKRIHGVKGIVQAHKRAATASLTEYFWVVDADNIIHDDFDFSFKWEKPRDGLTRVCVWKSVNGVNGLEYGNGGVKLLPKYPVSIYPLSQFNRHLDFATTIEAIFHYDQTVASTNNFNTSPFHSWRAGFREVFKLRTKLEGDLDDKQAKDIGNWIEVWLSEGEDAPYGADAIRGANDALKWYDSGPRNPEKINDFSYLSSMWEMTYGH